MRRLPKPRPTTRAARIMLDCMPPELIGLAILRDRHGPEICQSSHRTKWT